jgi:hypothetical protein
MGQIKQINEIQDQLFHMYKYGQNPGYKIGFKCLDDLYSIKEGRSTIIYGHPTSGKSQFLIQILCSLATKHGKKHLIYTPETGSAYEIYAEIIHCLTGKSFDKRSLNYHITEKELHNVIPFVHDYFKVIDVDEKGLDFDEWLDITDEAIKDYDIFTSSVDNWNDIEHNSGQMISEYLKKQLPRVNRHARKNGTHNFIVAHARNPDMSKGDKFPPAPRPDEIEGGSVWYAKALNLICVHRDYEEFEDTWRQSSEAQIIIRKMKKRAEGRKGTAKLTFDVYRNAYFEGLERYYLPTPFNGLENIKPF